MKHSFACRHRRHFDWHFQLLSRPGFCLFFSFHLAKKIKIKKVHMSCILSPPPHSQKCIKIGVAMYGGGGTAARLPGTAVLLPLLIILLNIHKLVLVLVLHFSPPARPLFPHRFDDSESWWIHFWTEKSGAAPSLSVSSQAPFPKRSKHIAAFGNEIKTASVLQTWVFFSTHPYSFDIIFLWPLGTVFLPWVTGGNRWDFQYSG